MRLCVITHFHRIFTKNPNMEKQISVVWKGNMAFEAKIDQYSVMMDATPAVGGTNQGPTPKPLLMASLGGCTGMDVVALCKKMRQEVESLEIILKGTIADEHPMKYESIHLIYEFKGRDLEADKLQKAVDLSQEKYCGVSETLKRGMPVTYEIRIL
jgi:putative redox protein